MKTTLTVPAYKCLRCGHLTVTRNRKAPARCGRCRSPYWSTPRKK